MAALSPDLGGLISLPKDSAPVETPSPGLLHCMGDRLRRGERIRSSGHSLAYEANQSKPDWRPWRVSCDNARATPVPIRMGTFRSGPMGSQTKCEIPLCRCGGRGARCRYAREFFPQAQPWVCEIGSHRSVPLPVFYWSSFPPLVKARASTAASHVGRTAPLSL